MPPSLSSYQQAASDIYEPQKAAEATTLATNKQNTINTLEGGKSQISSDYQAAIDDLNSTLKSNIGKINQLYTERLGGNFSGLQGNDLGGMFATASKNQAAIETTRANKLNDISISEANVTNTYNTDVSNLTSKYQSEEARYADTNYGSAVKDYETQQYRQAQLGLSQQRLNNSNSNKANALPSAAEVRSYIQSGLQRVTGKNDHYVAPQDYALALKDWLAAGLPRAQFNKQYSNYRDPKNSYYDYAIKQAGL